MAYISAEAESDERALELLRAGSSQGPPYDVAILDLMMPEMNGFQLAKAIKAEPSIAAVTLVLLASFGKRGHGEEARQQTDRREVFLRLLPPFEPLTVGGLGTIVAEVS
jgi:CheY-like chemotaxis protein